MAYICKKRSLSKGVMAGLLGGIAGAWAMDLFQSSWSHLTGDSEYSRGAHSPKQDGSQVTDPRTAPGSRGDTPATIRLASAVSRGLFNQELTSYEKKSAATAVHYGFGATAGAFYGLIAEYKPGVTAMTGLPFGAAVWLAVDEMGLPLINLSRPPQEYPPSKHVYSLAAHFVYGLATEATRRLIRNLPGD